MLVAARDRLHPNAVPLPLRDEIGGVEIGEIRILDRMAEILRRCGDELTRANVLKQATTLAGFHSPYFLDGVNFSYTPEDYTPMKTLYISIFNGKDWDISDKPVTE